jgi:hypothetical protein
LSGRGFRAAAPGRGLRLVSRRWLRPASGIGLRPESGSGCRAEKSGSGFRSATGEEDGRGFLSEESGNGFRTESGRGFRTLIVPEADGAGEEETREALVPFVTVDNAGELLGACFEVGVGDLAEDEIDLARQFSGWGACLCTFNNI